MKEHNGGRASAYIKVIRFEEEEASGAFRYLMEHGVWYANAVTPTPTPRLMRDPVP